jgi:hypothetical protein
MRRPTPAVDTRQAMQESFVYESTTGKLRWKTRNSGSIRVGYVAGRQHMNGHLEVGFNKKTYMAHHIAWFLHYGEWPDALVLHANGDKGDNRIENLVQAERSRA